MPIFNDVTDEANTWETAQQQSFAFTGYMHGFSDTDFFRLAVGPGTYQVSVLPDLARIEYPPGSGLPSSPVLQQETDFSAGVYERVVQTNGQSGLVLRSSLAAHRDDLAMQGSTTISDIQFYSQTVTLEGARNLGGSFYTGEYFLQVNGQAVPLLLGNGDPLDSSRFTPNAGRYLVTVDNPTGQRSTNWGGWIDTFEFADGSGVGDPIQPPGDEPDLDTPIPSILGPYGAIPNGLNSIPGERARSETNEYFLDPVTQEWSLPGTIPAFDVDLPWIGKGWEALRKGMADEFLQFVDDVAQDLLNSRGLNFMADVARAFRRNEEVKEEVLGFAEGTLDDIRDFSNNGRNGDDLFQRLDDRWNNTRNNLMENLQTGSDTADSIIEKLFSSIRMTTEQSNISFTFDWDIRDTPQQLFARAGHRDGFQGGQGNDFFQAYDRDDFLYGAGGDDELHGGLDNDTILGGRGRDQIFGETGNDVLWGNVDDDTIDGGDDDDDIYGGAGNDRLIGGNGRDEIFGGADSDLLFGDGGNDDLRGESGSDLLWGGDGDDLFVGGGGSDIFTGGTGRDEVAYQTSNSSVEVDLARDRGIGGDADGDRFGSIENLIGSSYGDTLNGDNGDNWIYGLAGNDRMWGETGNDLLVGGEGADILTGGAGRDSTTYHNANDSVRVVLFQGIGRYSDAEGDLFGSIEDIIGSQFSDELFGDNAANALAGLGGHDNLYGETGNDALDGGDGHDKLFGMDGNDVLIGRGGIDRYVGGAGADTFVFVATNDSVAGATDEIVDFSAAQGDRIQLSDIDANELVGGDQAFSFIGSAAFSANGQLRYAGGFLEGDINNDRVADFRIQLNVASLSSTDFIL